MARISDIVTRAPPRDARCRVGSSPSISGEAARNRGPTVCDGRMRRIAETCSLQLTGASWESRRDGKTRCRIRLGMGARPDGERTLAGQEWLAFGELLF